MELRMVGTIYIRGLGVELLLRADKAFIIFRVEEVALGGLDDLVRNTVSEGSLVILLRLQVFKFEL